MPFAAKTANAASRIEPPFRFFRLAAFVVARSVERATAIFVVPRFAVPLFFVVARLRVPAIATADIVCLLLGAGPLPAGQETSTLWKPKSS